MIFGHKNHNKRCNTITSIVGYHNKDVGNSIAAIVDASTIGVIVNTRVVALYI